MDICFLMHGVHEFLAGGKTDLPPGKQIFIIETRVVHLEIMRTMKRHRSNFAQQIICECLLSGLRILCDTRKSEENY